MTVFQEFDQLLPWRTVLGNVRFALERGRGFERREATEIARDWLGRVGLGPFAGVYPHTLSGGMKQRVAIARAFALQPALLLMDEPFAALDAITRRHMQDELLSLCEQTGSTALFVTHGIDEALRVGTRILALTPHPGRITASFAVPEGSPRTRLAGVRGVGASHPAKPVRPHGALMTDLAAPHPSLANRLADTPWRRVVILAALAAIWELYARWLDNPLLLPTLGATCGALWAAILSGELPDRTLTSLRVLLSGYLIGIAVAATLTALAALSRWGSEALGLLTSMFNPLPAIALLPVALLWFGIGTPSLIFVIVHSVLWPVALACHSGFLGVPPTLRMAGRNIGLSGGRFVVQILVPAAFPEILSGLRIGWAFAWRTLIAAELVFGVSARSGGLGWFIYTNRAQLETASVFAGLLTVILIGLLVEGVIFNTISKLTVERWGQQLS